MGKVAGGVMLTTSAEVQKTCSCTYSPSYPFVVKVKGTGKVRQRTGHEGREREQH